MDFTFALIVFLVFSFFLTLFFQKKFKAETYFFISLWHTQKFNNFFNNYKHPLQLLLSKIGLIFGFGFLAIDYLFLQKYPRKLRVFSFFFFSLLFAYFLSPLIQPYLTLYKEQSFMISFFLISFGFAGFTLSALISNATDIILSFFTNTTACPGIAPVIPGVEIPKVNFTPPLHAWLSLLIILVVHESFHGFVARIFKIPLKSAGVLLLGFLPIGAFVEPDEKALTKNKNSIYVYSAGPSSNLLLSVLAFAFILLLSSTFLFFYSSTINQVQNESSLGVYILAVDENLTLCGKVYPSPAYGYLQKGDKILKLNNQDINHLNNFYQFSTQKDLNIQVLRNSEVLSFYLTKNSLNRIGILMEEKTNPLYTYPENYLLYTQSFSFIIDFFYWLAILSFLVAIANFLPIIPFDGGHIIPFLLLPLFGKRDYKKILILLLIPIIFINILPLFL